MTRRRRAQATSGERSESRIALYALLCGGLALRLALTPFGVFRGDADAFGAWGRRLVERPLRRFYPDGETLDSTPGSPVIIIDHLPGDLWIHWAIAHLYRLFSPEMAVERLGYTFLIKLVPTLADVGIGLLLYLIARRIADERAGLLAAGLYLFNPATLFLSVTWGQWDAVSALVLLAAIWLTLRGTPEWALPVLVYACLIKPQFALIFPLLAVAWWRESPPAGGAGGRQRARDLAVAGAASLGVFLLVCLPFNVGVPPLPTRWTIFERVSVAADLYPLATVNAYNLWGLLVGDAPDITDDRTFLGLSYQHWGWLLLLATFGLIVTLYWRRTTPLMLIWATLATTMSLFVVPTRIHERYLLPAVMLATLFAALRPRYTWLAAALSLTYFANLLLVYRRHYPLPFGDPSPPAEFLVRAISAINVGLWIAVLVIGVALALPERQPAARAPATARRAQAGRHLF